jgi:predicted glycoside hydrolase/deacetylase ChbG (UPF0249 family)
MTSTSPPLRLGRKHKPKVAFLFHRAAGAVAFAAALFAPAAAHRACAASLVQQLGYQPSARVLIVTCDDLGAFPPANKAAFRALEQGIATSADVIIPGNALEEVVAWRRKHPSADLGVHLTLTSEFARARWRPVLGWHVASLTDADGAFWPDLSGLWRHMTPADAYWECRAQIEKAYRLGLAPSHLTNHMYSLQHHPRYWRDVYLRLAQEFNLPLRILEGEQPAGVGTLPQPAPGLAAALRRWWYARKFPAPRVKLLACERVGVLTPEYVIRLLNYPKDPAALRALYDEVLYALPAGKVCELYLHPAMPGPALRSIDPALAVREADYEWLVSPRTRQLIRKLGIKLVSYRRLAELQRRLRSSRPTAQKSGGL